MNRVSRVVVAIAVVAFTVVLTQGCVSGARHSDLQDRYNILNTEKNARLQELEALRNQDGSGAKQIAALQQRIADLQNQLAALNGQGNRLRAAHDKIKSLESSKTQQEQRIAALLKEIEDKTGLTGTMVDGMIRLNVSGDLLFFSGSNALKKPVQQTLTQLANVLKTDAAKVRVDGHTDNVPLRKTAKVWIDNLGLSVGRSTAVARFLAKHGVDQQIVYAAGYGEFQPVADNGDDAGKAKNRRVEIFILPKDIG